MPFITATREDGATLLINVDRIQYVAYRDEEGREEINLVFNASSLVGGWQSANEVVIHGEEARRVWEALSSLLSL